MRVNGSCKWRDLVNIGTGAGKSGKLWGNRGQFIGLMKKEESATRLSWQLEVSPRA